jgi:hypothetical protein
MRRRWEEDQVESDRDQGRKGLLMGAKNDVSKGCSFSFQFDSSFGWYLIRPRVAYSIAFYTHLKTLPA